MGVYIKGMDMPPNCCQCPVNMEVCKRGYEYLLEHPELYDKRADDCPLVPVPQPHGRLIDADALMLKILDYIEEYSDVDEIGWHNLKWCAMKEAEMAINNAPTIIPVEEGE